MKVLVVVMMVVLATLAHPEGKSRSKELCFEERDTIGEGERQPQCTAKGNYKNKQCDQQMCWCVSKRRGRKIFNKQKVPLHHRYDCKRMPQVCLKEELKILLKNPNAPWVPKCDCSGFYEEKQCERVASEECMGQRRKKRDHPLCEGTMNAIGFNPIERVLTDTSNEWTFVSKDAFTSDGEVRFFEIYVNEARPLRVGIYRPQPGKCNFKLIIQREWNDLTPGLQEVDLTDDGVFPVKAGDRYGFSWMNQGVIAYEAGKPSINYCQKEALFDEGDTANLDDNNIGKREYSIRLKFVNCRDSDEDDTDCHGNQSFLGFAPNDRGKLDTARFWTMVSKDAFSSDGEIHSFEMFVGETARALRVGIYRPTGTTCQFKLKQQVEWTGFMSGYVKVDLQGNDILKVKAGDRYGFTWLNFGVIDWGMTAEKNYCEKEAIYDVGDTASLNDQHGNREYSIKMRLTACDGSTPKCDECFCVDPDTGAEISGTRTTGELDCEA